jgi:hypothetical protein
MSGKFQFSFPKQVRFAFRANAVSEGRSTDMPEEIFNVFPCVIGQSDFLACCADREKRFKLIDLFLFVDLIFDALDKPRNEYKNPNSVG